MADIFQSILGMTLAGGILTLFVLAALPITKRLFSSKWHCILLCVVLLFFLLPIGTTASALLENHFNAAAFANESNFVALWDEISTPFSVTMIDSQAQTNSHNGNILETLLSFLPFVWLIGAALFLIFKFLHLVRFERLVAKSDRRIIDSAVLATFENIKKEMKISGRISLWLNPCIPTPMLMGLVHTRLILPQIDLNDRELELILRHELTHYRNHDLWIKLVSMSACAAHWFNPCIYALSSSLERFLEMSCDADVTKDMDYEQRRDYGAAILNVLNRASGNRPGLYAAFSSNKKAMKGRLSAVLNQKNKSKKIAVISIIVLLFACTIGIGVSAATYRETDKLEPFTYNSITTTATDTITEAALQIKTETEMVTVTEQRQERTQTTYSFLWPTEGGFIANGLDAYPGHTGIDIVVPLGTPVYASASGVVVYANSESNVGYGKYIVIEHSGGYLTLYAHCDSLDVSVGDMVEAGQTIAFSGRSGHATGPQLHFEIRRNGEAFEVLNPEDFVNVDNSPLVDINS